MRRIFLTIVISYTCILSFAQYKSPDPEKLKESKLIIILEEPKKRDKPQEIQFKENFNGRMKEVVEKIWVLGKEKEYITWKEYAKRRDAKEIKNAIVLRRDVHAASKTNYKSHTQTIYGTSYTLFIKRYDDKGEQADGTQAYISDDATLTQLMSMVQFLQERIQSNFSDYPSVDKSSANLKKLKNYTLLIDKDQLSSELTEEKVKAAYKFPCKVVSENEIAEAIVSKKENTAYFVITPCPDLGNKAFLEMVFLSKGDGYSLCRYGTGKASRGSLMPEKFVDIITEKMLGEYSDSVAKSK